MSNINIYHFSDTHGFHKEIPTSMFKDIDIVVFTGDAANSKNEQINLLELKSFVDWYKEVPVKHKIFVAGNHDVCIEKGLFTKLDFEQAGIIYLEDSHVEIEGLKIYGTPYTPAYYDWAFQMPREKMGEVWDAVPEDTDILLSHGPPLNILDAYADEWGSIEHVGDRTLGNLISYRGAGIRAICFGHIHSNDWVLNAGIMKHSIENIIYSNGSCVTDGRFAYGLTSFGNLIKI